MKKISNSLKVFLGALSAALAFFVSFHSFVYPRTEAIKLETKVDKVEENNQLRFERIERKLDEKFENVIFVLERLHHRQR